jgi:hypothetical protein
MIFGGKCFKNIQLKENVLVDNLKRKISHRDYYEKPLIT